MSSTASDDPGRRRHYTDFYDGVEADPGRPLLAVFGNCQAESLRLVLDDDDLRTVRVPAVHEWTADDLSPLDALLPRLDLLVTQRVGDDYRGLPVGTEQLLARTRPTLRHVLVPSLRYAGRSPFHVLVHPPQLLDPDPPMVPYHDLRTVVRAAWHREGLDPPPAHPLTREAVVAIAADSVDELRRRERLNGTLVASDLLTVEARPQMRTINHPGNDLFTALAVRVRSALGLEARPTRLDRPLLNHIHAPVEAAVAAVFGDVSPRETWVVDGEEIDLGIVERAQLAWYETRADVLDEVLRRSGRQLRHLGLSTPPVRASGTASTRASGQESTAR